MLAAVGSNLQATCDERLGRADRGEFSVERRHLRQLVDDVSRTPDLEILVLRGSGRESFDVNVVRVLVGDEHRVDPAECVVNLTEHARVDDEPAITVLQAHAGMGELRHLHGTTSSHVDALA